jgi:hypothetical protein
MVFYTKVQVFKPLRMYSPLSIGLPLEGAGGGQQTILTMLCQTCQRNKPLPKRKICGSCKTRQYRANNRLKAAFDALKHNAKRRKHGFDLTLEQFTKFAIATDYIVKRGITKDSYSIDRIDNNRGYTIDNLQIMTVSDNSKKRTKQVTFDWQSQDFFTITLPDIPTHDDSPF